MGHRRAQHRIWRRERRKRTREVLNIREKDGRRRERERTIERRNKKDRKEIRGKRKYVD
jgi:hypothetical protein